jgi:hypothetical protein
MGFGCEVSKRRFFEKKRAKNVYSSAAWLVGPPCRMESKVFFGYLF